jgi:sugar O-acyltransferase (sialic acid O-acetyltransferase NeuD family)
MNKKLLLIGGGGHCKSVLDCLLDLKTYSEIGIIDQKEAIGKTVMGVPIVGCDEDLESLFSQGYTSAFVTVGSIGNPSLRIKLFNLIREIGYEIPVISDPSATVSAHAQIEAGVFIGKQSIVNAGARIEKGAILNTGCIVEHDCRVGAFSHISPGAVLSGEVIIGKNTHIGANATVRQQVHIGSDSIIGMASVVLENIGAHVMAYGNPCKEVKKL